MTHPLLDLPKAFREGRAKGITSVCSAHPMVIEAALRRAARLGGSVLIEATCNQVNQDGGYTGMTPAAFRDFVLSIAETVGCPGEKIILGGDHLGPNPWKQLPAEAAMAKAEAMIAAYAEAGFTKLHLDTSMGCAGEPTALADEETAARAARLARVAEQRCGQVAPVYVVGTEVPVPGGAAHGLDELEITTAEAALHTVAVHRDAFEAQGVGTALERVLAIVVQPGVEFGHSDVVHFDAERARGLSAALSSLPGMVFEAHSTDYQTEAELRALVEGGFAILKVGPWLTFELRRALYALDMAADVLDGRPPTGAFMRQMDELMLAAPTHWKAYYEGPAQAQWRMRHFSYSDRIRYYWPSPEAELAVSRLLARFDGRDIPNPVLAQFFPNAEPSEHGQRARDLLIGAVDAVLGVYGRATE